MFLMIFKAQNPALSGLESDFHKFALEKPSTFLIDYIQEIQSS